MSPHELGSRFKHDSRNLDFRRTVDATLLAVEAAFNDGPYGFALQQISGGISAQSAAKQVGFCSRCDVFGGAGIDERTHSLSGQRDATGRTAIAAYHGFGCLFGFPRELQNRQGRNGRGTGIRVELSFPQEPGEWLWIKIGRAHV